MVEAVKLEKEDKYDVLQNAEGEILIIIASRNGGPESPRMVYDGSDSALLYRSRENTVLLEGINVDARKPLKSVDEVLFVEVDENEVAREYLVPLRIVKSLEKL